MNSGLIALVAVAGTVGVFLAVHLVRRFSVAVLTMRARAWVPSVSRLLSSWVNAHDYSGDAFFRADGANDRIVRRRLEALDRLSASFRDAHAKSADWGASVREGFSDIRFADANRVPFPFAKTMREKFDLTTVVTESDGPHLRDLDGHWSLDVSGSYGVNVAGIRALQGMDRARLESREGHSGRCSGPCIRSWRTTSRMLRGDLGPGRGVVSHERHRGGDGRGAPGAIQHRPDADRLLLGRVPRLVGRRRCRDSAAIVRSTTASRSRTSIRRRSR